MLRIILLHVLGVTSDRPYFLCQDLLYHCWSHVISTHVVFWHGLSTLSLLSMLSSITPNSAKAIIYGYGVHSKGLPLDVTPRFASWNPMMVQPHAIYQLNTIIMVSWALSTMLQHEPIPNQYSCYSAHHVYHGPKVMSDWVSKCSLSISISWQTISRLSIGMFLAFTP